MDRINSCRIILCIIVLFLDAGELCAEQLITKAIYDLPLEQPVFKDKNAGQIAQYLRDSGINAVVRVALDNSIIDQLHKNDIKVCAELVVFFAIYKVIGQDIEKLSGIVDVFSPMTYHLICGRDTAWITSVVQWTKSKTDRDVWPVVQSINEPSELSAEEYERALTAGLSGGSTGIITFTTGATLENGKWEAQKRVFTGWGLIN